MNDNMEIEPDALEAWLKDSDKTNPRLIDCREPEERLICHIEKSELIPLNKIEAAITEFKSNYKENFIIYCHHGIRSMHAVQFMRQLGFENTYSLAGGIERWAIEIDQSLSRY